MGMAWRRRAVDGGRESEWGGGSPAPAENEARAEEDEGTGW